MKNVKLNIIKRSVLVRGIVDIMFDRYPGDNKTELRPDQKLYLDSHSQIVLPSLNVVSFLCAINTPSAAKRFLDSRKYKTVAQAILSSVSVEPAEIPFLRGGKPIVFNGFDANDVDKRAQVYVHRSVARLDKGVPNPKMRPVLSVPWELRFGLAILPNDEVTEDLIQNLFIKGGLGIGFGTFHGVYGKFQVVEWK